MWKALSISQLESSLGFPSGQIDPSQALKAIKPLSDSVFPDGPRVPCYQVVHNEGEREDWIVFHRPQTGGHRAGSAGDPSLSKVKESFASQSPREGLDRPYHAGGERGRRQRDEHRPSLEERVQKRSPSNQRPKPHSPRLTSHNKFLRHEDLPPLPRSRTPSPTSHLRDARSKQPLSIPLDPSRPSSPRSSPIPGLSRPRKYGPTLSIPANEIPLPPSRQPSPSDHFRKAAPVNHPQLSEGGGQHMARLSGTVPEHVERGKTTHVARKPKPAPLPRPTARRTRTIDDPPLPSAPLPPVITLDTISPDMVDAPKSAIGKGDKDRLRGLLRPFLGRRKADPPAVQMDLTEPSIHQSKTPISASAVAEADVVPNVDLDVHSLAKNVNQHEVTSTARPTPIERKVEHRRSALELEVEDFLGLYDGYSEGATLEPSESLQSTVRPTLEVEVEDFLRGSPPFEVDPGQTLEAELVETTASTPTGDELSVTDISEEDSLSDDDLSLKEDDDSDTVSDASTDDLLSPSTPYLTKTFQGLPFGPDVPGVSTVPHQCFFLD